MDSLEKILKNHASWLADKLVSYAKDSGDYASLSDRLEACHPLILQFSALLAGKVSSARQRQRFAVDLPVDFLSPDAEGQGISPATSLRQLKLIRKAYIDLLHHVPLESGTRGRYVQRVHECFDEAEIELCDRWDQSTKDLGPSQGSAGGCETESVDEPQATETALRESQQKLDGIVSSMTDYLIMIDSDFVIEWANPAAKSHFGPDMIGKKCYDALCNAVAQCQQCAIAECMKDGSPHDKEKTIVRQNGHSLHLWCTANVATRSDDGRAKTYVQILRDVTELKRTQELLVETEGLRAVSELTSGVAHNFRNLLQVIMSAARLASMEMKDNNLEEADRALEQILRTSYFGAGTIKRIEEFARPWDEILERTDEIFDLSLTAAQAIEMSKPWWKSKPQRQGATVRVQRDLESGAWVKGQESRLFEAVVNLIRNAVEAFEGDGTISVKTSVRPPKVILTMEDNGPGIAPHHIPCVFQPFWTTKSGRGSGMGLATTRKIVTSHHGTISVNTILGRGSTFSIELPLAQAVYPVKEVVSGNEQRTPFHILVIDDVDQAATFLSKALQRIGHNVVSSVSGAEGLDRYHGSHFDAVLCDLCMPEMNGLEVGKRIKDTCEAQGIEKPVFILITGWADQELRPEEIAESGVDGVLEKPADLKRIQDLVTRLVTQARQA